MSTNFALPVFMIASTRIPDGRLEKARYYLTLAEADLGQARLQSAENFLRLAVFMDPENPAIAGLLNSVATERERQRTATSKALRRD